MSLYRLTACTGQHIGDRKDQQDRIALVQSPSFSGTALAVLADGMGGKTGGGMAAEQAVSTAVQLFNHFGEGELVETLLTQMVSESHTVIRLLSLSEEKEPHSTFVSMVVTPNEFFWVHVGDSRLYHFRQGELRQRTVDHSFVEQAISSGKMSEAQAKSHKFRNMLVSALGMPESPKYEIGGAHDPQAGDAFILASDGLWAYFEDHELGKILHAMSPREACELLVELTRERAQGRGDNLSFIIIKLLPSDSPEWATPLV